MKILDLAIMAVLSAAVTVGAALAYRQVWGVYEEKADDLPVIAEEIAVPLGDKAIENVTALTACYDAGGTAVAYRVRTQAMGYHPEQPIVLDVTVTADAKTLVEVAVVQQKESEDYGARIATEEFLSRFTGRKLPVFLAGTAGRGAHVDGISGATTSSKAVVSAVDTAYTFVRTYLVEGEE